MSIDLRDFESGLPYAGDYEADLERLERRLARVQAAFITRGARALIIFEGWSASGKAGLIRRLTRCWDPRWYDAWRVADPNILEQGHHFLWRFWQKLPAHGEIRILDGSWYGRVVSDRVSGRCDAGACARAYDEINEFEAQQRDSGTLIIKIFLHVTEKEQEMRFRARLKKPWKRWMISASDLSSRGQRASYLDAYADMFEQCHTRWAPWTVIDGTHKKAARMRCLSVVAEHLEGWVDMSPPSLDPDVEAVATRMLGTAPFFDNYVPAGSG